MAGAEGFSRRSRGGRRGHRGSPPPPSPPGRPQDTVRCGNRPQGACAATYSRALPRMSPSVLQEPPAWLSADCFLLGWACPLRAGRCCFVSSPPPTQATFKAAHRCPLTRTTAQRRDLLGGASPGHQDRLGSDLTLQTGGLPVGTLLVGTPGSGAVRWRRSEPAGQEGTTRRPHTAQPFPTQRTARASRVKGTLRR